MTTETTGRRERKKAATRKAISDAATLLFLERGYDNVSIREIADRADVSPTTVFAHFPSKEALIFDEEDEQRQEIVAVIRDRPAGTSILTVLHEHFRSDGIWNGAKDDQAAHLILRDERDDRVRQFMALVESTPALNDYAQRMWLRHEKSIAGAIADDFGLPAPTDEIRAFARFLLQVQLLAAESEHPQAALDAGFAVLERGWTAVVAVR